MGRKISLAQAMYQGEHIVTFACHAVNDGVACHHNSEVRTIEIIDAYGPRTRLDDLPARCAKCGRNDCVDVRARSYRRSGSHPDSPFIEGDGLPYGERHIWWLHEANGRNPDGSYWSACSRMAPRLVITDKNYRDQ